MSFAFTHSGTPKDLIAVVGQQAANEPQVPQAFADAINHQLEALPEDAHVSMACSGHTGWGEAQTKGEISLHLSLQVMTAAHPNAQPPE